MSRILLLLSPSPALERLRAILRGANQTPVLPPTGWEEDAHLVQRVESVRPDVVVFGADDGLAATCSRCNALMRARQTRFVPALVATTARPDEAAVRIIFDAGARDVLDLSQPDLLVAARIDNMARLNYLRRTFRRQNDALAARTAELDRVFETATTGLAIADAGGVVVRLNESGRAILGDQASASDLYRLLEEDGRAVSQEDHPLFRAAVRGDAVEGGRFQLPRGDEGAQRVIVMDAAPLHAAGGVLTGGLAVFRDETATWALEAALRDKANTLAERTEEMEAFVYTASHDMKSPLWTIRRYARMILEDQPTLDVDSRRFLERIELNADRLGRLVEDLLQVVKVGKMELVMEPCRLGGVVRAATNALGALLDSRQVEVQVEGELPTALGDFDRLTEVMANLLSNAVKYARPEGIPTVTVGVGPHLEGQCHVYVRDDGIGISEPNRDRIFGLFTRLHTRDKIEGSGLGLAIVSRIVARHGGRVWVESTEGEGSTFHVTLPAP